MSTPIELDIKYTCPAFKMKGIFLWKINNYTHQQLKNKNSEGYAVTLSGINPKKFLVLEFGRITKPTLTFPVISTFLFGKYLSRRTKWKPSWIFLKSISSSNQKIYKAFHPPSFAFWEKHIEYYELLVGPAGHFFGSQKSGLASFDIIMMA